MNSKLSFHNKALVNGVKGFLALIFGLIILFFPEISLITISTYFGIFALAGGVIMLVNAFINKTEVKKRIWLIEGIINVLIGALLIFKTEASISFIIFIMGLWALISGVLIFRAYSHFKNLKIARTDLLITSVLTTLFGVLLIVNPFSSAKVMASFIGLFAIIYGISAIFSSVKS